MGNGEKILLSLIVVVCTTFLIRELEYRRLRSLSPRRIVVEVRGCVREPGLLTLTEGSRVFHAVQGCGGATEQADLSGLSLARKLQDGDALTVPRRALRPPSSPKTKAGVSSVSEPRPRAESGPPYDLNTVDRRQLIALPGVGPVTADRILEARSKRGGSFHSLEDLATIRGIKGKTLSRLRPYFK